MVHNLRKSNELLHEGDRVQQLTNLMKGQCYSRLMCNIIKWPKLWAFVGVPNFSNKSTKFRTSGMGCTTSTKGKKLRTWWLVLLNNYNWYELTHVTTFGAQVQKMFLVKHLWALMHHSNIWYKVTQMWACGAQLAKIERTFARGGIVFNNTRDLQ